MTTNGNRPDLNDLGGPAALMEELKQNPERYGRLTPLPDRKNNWVRTDGNGGVDIGELHRQFGYSMPIAKMAEMSTKYQGFLRDGNIEELDEKAAVLDALAIHRMIISSDCVLRKARYEAEQEEADRWLEHVDPARRPSAFSYDPYTALQGSDGDSILKDYIDSLLEDQAMAEEEESDEDTPAAHRNGRDVKSRLPLLKDLLDRWGACDAFMLQVLLDEERYGIEYTERHYDTYVRVEGRRRDIEFEASLLPYAENAYFWCRVRQMSIVRERSYDVAMGHPIHDYSDVVAKLDGGGNIHDLAQQLDWSFDNAYRRVMGSMIDGKEYRLTLAALIAQQIPISSQMSQMMPPPGFWYGGGPQQPMLPGQEGNGEEAQPDKRGAVFNFFNKNKNGGGQPAPDRKKNRRRSGRS